jgi:hypothetical protein
VKAMMYLSWPAGTSLSEGFFRLTWFLIVAVRWYSCVLPATSCWGEGM